MTETTARASTLSAEIGRPDDEPVPVAYRHALRHLAHARQQVAARWSATCSPSRRPMDEA